MRKTVKQLFADKWNDESFKFINVKEHDFVTSQWQNGKKPHPIYLGYRCLFALYHISVVIFMITKTAGPNGDYIPFFFIYLTNLSYLLLMISSIIMAVNAVVSFVKSSKLHISQEEDSGLHWRFCIQWWVQTTSILAAVFVTLIFWTMLFPAIVKSQDAAHVRASLAFNIFAHLLNSVTSLADLAVNRVPFRLLHFYVPFSYTLIYLLFNVVYWAAGGVDPYGHHWIYPITDWSNMSATGPLLPIIFVALAVVHVFIWLLDVLKYAVWHRRNNHTEPERFEGSIIVTT